MPRNFGNPGAFKLAMDHGALKEYRAAVVEYSKLVNGLAGIGMFSYILDARVVAAGKRCEMARKALQGSAGCAITPNAASVSARYIDDLAGMPTR
jgi:hypothetical protein